MSVYRRTVPIAITFLVCVLIVFPFFFKVTATDTASGIILLWGTIISAFAVCLGAATTFLSNISKVRRREKGTWYTSIWLVIVMLTFVVVGVSKGPADPTYKTLFNTFIPMLTTAVWALVGASTVSATIRCFKFKSFDTALIIIPALFLVMMSTPLFDAYWEGFAIGGKWINEVPSLAGNRGYIIGAAVGAIAVCLRILAGKEVGYMGRE